MSATVAAPVVPALTTYLLRQADTALVLAQRLSAWIGHAPAIEEDLGVANIVLDLIGQARLLYGYAGECEGQGRSEDDFAYLREGADFVNVTLAELPNGDFGRTIARQCVLDVWRLETFERLTTSSDVRLAAIAAKAVREIRYHLRYSSAWLVRLGDGTEDSKARVSVALKSLWPYTVELFHDDAVEVDLVARRVVPDCTVVRAAFESRLAGILADATLERPADSPFRWFGKQGAHTEHLGHLLADMQSLHRAHPGVRW